MRSISCTGWRFKQTPKHTTSLSNPLRMCSPARRMPGAEHGWGAARGGWQCAAAPAARSGSRSGDSHPVSGLHKAQPVCYTAAAEQLAARYTTLPYFHHRKPRGCWQKGTPGCPVVAAAALLSLQAPLPPPHPCPPFLLSSECHSGNRAGYEKRVRREALSMLEEDIKADLKAPKSPCQPQTRYRVPPRRLPQTGLRHGTAAERDVPTHWRAERRPENFTSVSQVLVHRSPPRDLYCPFSPLLLKFYGEFYSK